METRKRILIGSANQHLGRGIQNLLAVHGFQITLVDTGEEMLAEMISNRYHLVILGPRFLEQIPASLLQQIINVRPAEVQIVVLSFQEQIEDLEVRLPKGHVTFYSVYASPEELLKLVEDRLGRAPVILP